MSSPSVALSPSLSSDRSVRLGARARLQLPLLAGVATLLVAWAGLVFTHHQAQLAVPKAVALHHILSDPVTGRMVTSLHPNSSDATPMDSRYEVIAFYRGARMVATVTVGFHGQVRILEAENLVRQRYAYGSNIANDPRVLGVLGVMFVMMTAVWPLWRLRNLDVLVSAATVLSVVLFNRWLLTPMVLVSYPALIYLALRCAWRGLGPRREPAAATPLYDHLLRNLEPERRLRILRLGLAAAALVTVMVGLTSLHVLDVGYAVMEGATSIAHGLSPYGHIADIPHGDTYPIGSYLLYTPFAWASPVHDAWDNADATLAVAVAAALALAAGLWRLLGAGPLRAGRRSGRAGDTGPLRAAIALLTFPPLLVTVSTGTTDVALAAMLVAALVLWRRPGWGTAALSGAAWFKLAPVAILPLMLARLRGRALGRALAAVLIISTAMLCALIALGGLSAPLRMLSAISFQFTRSSPHTLWPLVGSVPLQQLVQAATLALVVGAALRLRGDRALAADRLRWAAIAGAVLLGLQISANYWNYMYLVWVFPFVAVALLGEGGLGAKPISPRGNDTALG